MSIVYGSVSSGIEAATVAWHPLGWRPAFLSEIAAFPRAVLTHHYPTVPLHGDFTTIGAEEYEPIDLLVGGTPCQSFSVAGLRGGLDDERGNLALEYLRLADRKRPRWLVWENVPGVLSSSGGRDFGAILGGMVELGYGVAYRVLDAQHFGVPQRRRRVFVVGYLGDWRRSAAVLFERHSLSGDHPPRRKTGKGAPAASAFGISPDCLDRTGEGAGGTAGERSGLGIDEEVAYALRAKRAGAVAYGGNNTSGAIDVATALNAHGGPMGRMDFESASSAVRRLTPTECERLQGFPDGYTQVTYRGKPAADGPRYKALGNSMAVPVMRWLGERIDLVEKYRSERVSDAA